jgi:hypothetical protein
MSLTSVNESLFAGWARRSVAAVGVALAIELAAGCTSDAPLKDLNHVCKLNSDCTGSSGYKRLAAKGEPQPRSGRS